MKYFPLSIGKGKRSYSEKCSIRSRYSFTKHSSELISITFMKAWSEWDHFISKQIRNYLSSIDWGSKNLKHLSLKNKFILPFKCLTCLVSLKARLFFRAYLLNWFHKFRVLSYLIYFSLDFEHLFHWAPLGVISNRIKNRNNKTNQTWQYSSTNTDISALCCNS